MDINQLSLLDAGNIQDNRCVVLLRVSTKDQVEGHSLGAQKSTAYRYADKNNLKIVKVFEFHESASNSKKRVIFDQVLSYVIQNNIAHLVSEKTDRVSRNFSDSGRLEDLVENHGLHIHLIKEKMVLHKNSSAHDKAMFGYKVLGSRNFGHNLVEEVIKAFEQKVEKGLPPGNYPYAYKPHHKTKCLMVDKNQAEVVKKIYSLFASGKYSLIEIADILNKEGIPSPSQARENRIQSQWRSISVRIILQRPNYHGDFLHNGVVYRGKFEPIVSYQSYKQCAKLLAKQRRKRRVIDASSHPYVKNIFTHLLENPSGKRASLCVKNIKIRGSSQGRKYAYYKLYFTLDKLKYKSIECTERSVYEAVDKAICSLSVQEILEQQVHKIEQDIFTKKKELHKLRQKTKDLMCRLKEERCKLISLYTENTISKQEFDEQRKIIAAKIAENHRKLSSFRFTRQERENQLCKIKHIYEFSNKHKLYLSARSKEEKLAILNSLLVSIIVEPDRKIKICFKHPYTFITSVDGYIIKASSYDKGHSMSTTSKQAIHRNQSGGQIMKAKPQNKISHIFKSIPSNNNQIPLVNKSFNST